MTDWVDRTTGEIIDLSQPDGPVRALLAQSHIIDQLGERLQELVRSLETRRTDAREVSAAEFVDAPSGWAWKDLGPVGAQVLWDRLREWVGWLRGRYPIAELVPPCWWRHPELVEELTALWLAWRTAYTDPTAVMTQPADCHDRWLPGVLHRVKQWGVFCDRTHRDRPDTIYDQSGTNDKAFQHNVRDDLAQRIRTATAASTGSGEVMDATRMTLNLANGSAVRVGSLPRSPVRLGEAYWFEDGQTWRRIDDPELIARLRRDEERLRQADEAVRRHRERRGDEGQQ